MHARIKSALTVKTSAMRPEIVIRRLYCICKEEGHRGIGCDYSWVFPCTRGIPTDENSDVAIESSDNGMSEYGRDEDYMSLVSVPPALNETIEEPTSVPATVNPPSTATLRDLQL